MAGAPTRPPRGHPDADPLLDAVLAADPPAFALLHRPESALGPGRVEILTGEVTTVDKLADLPGDPLNGPGPAHELLAVVPYRQISERGYACHDDGEPIITMSVDGQSSIPLDEVVRRLPSDPADVRGGDFDLDDQSYAEVVRTVLADEIGQGSGSNFVIKRSYTGDVGSAATAAALATFRRLLLSESGAYWTFVVHTGARTFVGATPERHVSLDDGVAVMNPISGTYRYAPAGPRLQAVIDFLSDRKESDELSMVVDEELKMMAGVCERGGQVEGPYLREMAKLAHTEYLIRGRSSLDARSILRETMFAPTVTGSPIENACRVIARHEPDGRAYYGGVIALIGRDAAARRTLDSAILIRTADIHASGTLRLATGSTLIRLSDPMTEAAETRAKIAAMLAALGAASGTGTAEPPPHLGRHPRVRSLLRDRNDTLAGFWLTPETARRGGSAALRGRRALVIDAEDTFTGMLAQHLRTLGLLVTILPYDQVDGFRDADVVMVGPGPGDPRDPGDHRIATLRRLTRRLLDEGVPFLSVCLGHQVLASTLGLELARRDSPNQGVQAEVDFFGRPERVGFYNTFSARCPRAGEPYGIELSRDAASGEIHAVRGPGFASVQFHPESLLTQNGSDILRELLTTLVGPRTTPEEVPWTPTPNTR